MQGNTLITKKANNMQKIETKEFTDSGFVQTYINNSIIATRTFKKIKWTDQICNTVGQKILKNPDQKNSRNQIHK